MEQLLNDAVTAPLAPGGRMPWLADSDLGPLDNEARTQCDRTLAAAAYVYAGVYFAAFLFYFLTSHARDGQFTSPEPRFIVTTVLSIAMALAVARKAPSSCSNTTNFARVAQAFLVLSCLGIASSIWGWQFHVIEQHAGVHWVGVWIIGFSATITLTPRMLLQAGMVSSLTIPLVMVCSVLVSGFPPQWEGSGWAVTRDATITLLGPVWICVLVAVAIAGRQFHLAKDASKARRMGAYKLEEKIGAGGMGEVWRGSHRMLARPAAIKIIRDQGTPSSSGESAGTVHRRFEREARATAALTSPHTVEVYDFGITDEGTFYYVMELLRGMDLRTLVEKTGPLPPARVVHFMRQACDSLGDAHRHGMIHRDIKPANLLTCHKGLTFDFLKVLDFGLVKVLSRKDEADSQLTLQGIASGTPGYMAPEIATEEQTLDGRADLYALGCVGWWLLTGEMVFSAKSPVALLLKHVNDTPPLLRESSEMDVPEVLESIIMDCLAKSPEDRPESAQELGRRLSVAEQEIGRWTAVEAEAWWSLHLPEFVETMSAPQMVSSTGTPILSPAVSSPGSPGPT